MDSIFSDLNVSHNFCISSFDIEDISLPSNSNPPLIKCDENKFLSTISRGQSLKGLWQFLEDFFFVLNH